MTLRMTFCHSMNYENWCWLGVFIKKEKNRLKLEYKNRASTRVCFALFCYRRIKSYTTLLSWLLENVSSGQNPQIYRRIGENSITVMLARVYRHFAKTKNCQPTWRRWQPDQAVMSAHFMESRRRCFASHLWWHYHFVTFSSDMCDRQLLCDLLSSFIW